MEKFRILDSHMRNDTCGHTLSWRCRYLWYSWGRSLMAPANRRGAGSCCSIPVCFLFIRFFWITITNNIPAPKPVIKTAAKRVFAEDALFIMVDFLIDLVIVNLFNCQKSFAPWRHRDAKSFRYPLEFHHDATSFSPTRPSSVFRTNYRSRLWLAKETALLGKCVSSLATVAVSWHDDALVVLETQHETY